MIITFDSLCFRNNDFQYKIHFLLRKVNFLWNEMSLFEYTQFLRLNLTVLYSSSSTVSFHHIEEFYSGGKIQAHTLSIIHSITQIYLNFKVRLIVEACELCRGHRQPVQQSDDVVIPGVLALEHDAHHLHIHICTRAMFSQSQRRPLHLVESAYQRFHN